MGQLVKFPNRSKWVVFSVFLEELKKVLVVSEITVLDKDHPCVKNYAYSGFDHIAQVLIEDDDPDVISHIIANIYQVASKISLEHKITPPIIVYDAGMLSEGDQRYLIFVGIGTENYRILFPADIASLFQ